VRGGVATLPAPRAPTAKPALGALLSSYRVAAPRSAFAATPEEAGTQAARLGFPVALKIVSPQASHKTEIGGVALGLRAQADVRAAADAMATRLRAQDPTAKLKGFLLQEMVQGLEVIVGVREDPQFGPFMLVGLGGIQVEAMRDVAIRLLPVDAETANGMVASLRGASLLGAFRGQPARDVEALVTAMTGLSRLFIDQRGWMSEIEINPLMVLAAGLGVRAVDVRMTERKS